MKICLDLVFVLVQFQKSYTDNCVLCYLKGDAILERNNLKAYHIENVFLVSGIQFLISIVYSSYFNSLV